MGQPFDPYLKWLGIPPKQRPPNDYRLLGIELFEVDPDVISNAADQRMAHLKNFSVGQHSHLSQKILNQIAAARVRLLNPQAKAEYDAALRERLKEQFPAARETSAPPSLSLPHVISVDTAELRGPQRRRSRWRLPAAIGLGMVSAALLLVLFLVAGGEKTDSEQGRRPGDQVATVAKSATQSSEQKPLPPQQEPTPSDQRPQPDQQQPRPDEQEPQPDRQQLRSRTRPTRPRRGTKQEPQPDRQRPQPKEEVPPPVHPEPRPDQPDSQPNLFTRIGSSEPATSADHVLSNRVLTKRVKTPEPAEEAKRKAGKEIRDLYAKELRAATTPETEVALADKLRRVAQDEPDRPVVRFVLLRMACDLATKAEDKERSLAIVDQMGQWYEVDAWGLKADVLNTLAKSVARRRAGVAANRQVAFAAEKLADQALGAANLKAADRLWRVALFATRRMKDKRRAAALQAKINDLPRLEAQFDAFQEAVAALKKNPDDCRANVVVGSWYCFVAGDWKKGLPCLAKGDHDQLAETAKRDMANPQDPKQQAELGHRWWEVSRAKKGTEASRLQGRAVHWYQQALPRLSGLEHSRLKKQLDKIGLNLGQHALKFDGRGSHVVVHNFGYTGISTQGPIPITVEAIVKPAGKPAPGNAPGGPYQSEQVVFGNLDASGLALGTKSGRWSFSFCYSFQRDNALRSASHRIVAGSVVPGKWVHVAGVYDAKQLRLYVDGKLRGSTTLPSPHSHRPSDLPFLIGARPKKSATPHVTGFFNGLIKAIRVSNSARYEGNALNVPTELERDGNSVLLLLLGGGKGNRVQDASGGNALGLIQGAEWTELDINDLSTSNKTVAPASRR